MKTVHGPITAGSKDQVFRTFLPEDLEELHDYLAIVKQLIDERSRENGECWSAERASQSELEALLLLEEEISKRVADVQSGSIGDVLGKFEIWDMLLENDSNAEETSGRDQLIRSIRRDLEQLPATMPLKGREGR